MIEEMDEPTLGRLWRASRDAHSAVRHLRRGNAFGCGRCVERAAGRLDGAWMPDEVVDRVWEWLNAIENAAKGTCKPGRAL